MVGEAATGRQAAGGAGSQAGGGVDRANHGDGIDDGNGHARAVDGSSGQQVAHIPHCQPAFHIYLLRLREWRDGGRAGRQPKPFHNGRHQQPGGLLPDRGKLGNTERPELQFHLRQWHADGHPDQRHSVLG